MALARAGATAAGLADGSGRASKRSSAGLSAARSTRRGGAGEFDTARLEGSGGREAGQRRLRGRAGALRVTGGPAGAWCAAMAGGHAMAWRRAAGPLLALLPTAAGSLSLASVICHCISSCYTDVK